MFFKNKRQPWPNLQDSLRFLKTSRFCLSKNKRSSIFLKTQRLSSCRAVRQSASTARFSENIKWFCSSISKLKALEMTTFLKYRSPKSRLNSWRNKMLCQNKAKNLLWGPKRVILSRSLLRSKLIRLRAEEEFWREVPLIKLTKTFRRNLLLIWVLRNRLQKFPTETQIASRNLLVWSQM